MTRISALFLALFVAASSADAAWQPCTRWPSAAAGAHDCCESANTQAAVRAVEDDCCGISQPSRDRGPIEVKFTPSPAMRTSLHTPAFVCDPDGARLRQGSAPLPQPVPRYLRCSSLLI